MENINIAEILKNCPKGTKLYSPFLGDVYVERIIGSRVIVNTMDKNKTSYEFDQFGVFFLASNGECMLFPSKEQRNWSRFDSQVSVSYFIDECGKVWFHKGEKTEEDIRRSEFGNEFVTREQAEYAAEKVKELLLSLRKKKE